MSVSLSMVPVETVGDPGSRDAVQVHNLVVRTTWAHAAGFQAAMETEYSARGTLLETRSCTLVPAANAIPSMAQPAGNTPSTP